MHMGSLRNISAFVAALCVCVAFPAYGNLNIDPTPARVTEGSGSFALREGGCIVVPSNARAAWIGEFLSRQIEQRTHVHLNVGSAAKGRSHCIVLSYDTRIKERGGYRLDVTDNDVVLAAKSNRGLFWGVQTIRQMLDNERGSAASLSAVHIEDAPGYPWRGFMLDVARTFYPVSFIKEQISLMSYYKLNVLHLHLTDDQGWRLQIKKYPKLTSVGAWRTEPNGSRYGGFYTRDEMRSIIRYAANRNVMVVPEIEMPGHTSAAIAAYPKLACNELPIDPPTTLGTTLNSDCVGNEYTYQFLENVLREVSTLFPSPYIHIGTDEVPSDSWMDCKSCAALARANGFSNTQKDLQGYFVARIAKFLQTLGKTTIGWDEALQGGMAPKSLIVEAWRNASYADESLHKGNRLIVAWPFYMSTPIRYMTLRDAYDSNPFQSKLLGTDNSNVLGGEAALWTNHPPDSPEARVYPRLIAIAEHLWNPGVSNWSNFEAKLPAQEEWLQRHGVAIGPNDVDVAQYHVTFVPGEDRWGTYNRWRIRAYRGFDDVAMHYTLDGAEPTSASPSFARVLQVRRATVVTVAPFRGTKMYQAPERFEFVADPLLGEKVSSSIRPVSGSVGQLTDGILGGTDGSYAVYSNRRWVVWPHSGTELKFAVPSDQRSGTVDVRFLQDSSVGAWAPEQVRFSVSTDGVHWKSIGSERLMVGYAARGVRHVYMVKRALPPNTKMVSLQVVGQDSAGRDVWVDEVTLQ